MAFELASKVGDAIPYCAKAISLCKSRIHNLKIAKEGLLADKDLRASAAKGHSGKSTLEDEISYLARMLPRFQKKVNKLNFIHATSLVLLMNLVLYERRRCFVRNNNISLNCFGSA